MLGATQRMARTHTIWVMNTALCYYLVLGASSPLLDFSEYAICFESIERKGGLLFTFDACNTVHHAFERVH